MSNEAAKRGVLLRPNRNPISPDKPQQRERRAKSAVADRERKSKPIEKVHEEKVSLQQYGYHFKDGKLVSIDDDSPFEYNVYPDKVENSKRYNAIGRLVTRYIYELLEQHCNLRRVIIPLGASNSEPTGFIFTSQNFDVAPYLMIIIHGSGAVRAGQWSRSLIINESLKVGSQLDYIIRAQDEGYGVIVTNTNLNTDESDAWDPSRRRRINGSESPEAHACYVWEYIITKCQARHICIMAHSYGGAVVVALASRFTRDFDKRVFAVALTDSPMKSYLKSADKKIFSVLKKRTVNWVADQSRVNSVLADRDYAELRSAGHTLHEWTSYTAFENIFEFFAKQRQRLR